MQTMNIIEFKETVLFDEGGLETSLFKSNNFDGEYSSQRACMIAVLSQICDPEIISSLSDLSLELALLTNNIYIDFIDS